MSYPDGTIGGLWGPFDDESDTTIMKRVLEEARELKDYLVAGDTIVYDRGFKGKALDDVGCCLCSLNFSGLSLCVCVCFAPHP
jgi:hypothetical protein